jgi:Beta-ketoacyl synthase, C-terminal domain
VREQDYWYFLHIIKQSYQFMDLKHIINLIFICQKVMESLEHAMKRDAPIIAEYLGGAVNCDAYHMTDPRADGLGVSSCIKQSLENAGVAPEEVVFSQFVFLDVIFIFFLELN